jgi:hypothetical protein
LLFRLSVRLVGRVGRFILERLPHVGVAAVQSVLRVAQRHLFARLQHLLVVFLILLRHVLRVVRLLFGLDRLEIFRRHELRHPRHPVVGARPHRAGAGRAAGVRAGAHVEAVPSLIEEDVRAVVHQERADVVGLLAQIADFSVVVEVPLVVVWVLAGGRVVAGLYVAAMVITDAVQVVQVVVGVRLLPGPLERTPPVGHYYLAVVAVHRCAALVRQMGRHVQVVHGEVHHRGKLRAVAAPQGLPETSEFNCHKDLHPHPFEHFVPRGVNLLPKPLEVHHQNVRQRPHVQCLHHRLVLLTVRTPPRVRQRFRLGVVPQALLERERSAPLQGLRLQLLHGRMFLNEVAVVGDYGRFGTGSEFHDELDVSRTALFAAEGQCLVDGFHEQGVLEVGF